VAASIALMAGVVVQLAREAIVDVPTGVIAAVALLALMRWRLNSGWLVLAGGITGLLIDAFG
jgi:chromate transporter